MDNPLNHTPVLLTNKNWSSWSKAIAAPNDPTENSPAAMRRLMEKLRPYFYEIKGVRPQFHARNGVQLISFQTEWERKYYNTAVDRWYEAMAKIDTMEKRARGYMLLVELGIFKRAAEVCRSDQVGFAMNESVEKNGQAAVYACCYQASIAKTVGILSRPPYNVPRSKISIIWGGNDNFNLKKSDHMSMDNVKDILMRSMRGEVIEPRVLKKMLAQFKAQENDLGDISGLDLGSQSRKARQEEIDRFLRGDSLYCFYTFKSGGVGLSLHHTDELTKEKVRRDPESGYANVEDIGLIPTRPRITFLSPTYSAIELVQGLGRVPRLTSLSDTPQRILFYKNTIEERVAVIVSSKLLCLKEVIQQRESWEDAIIDNSKRTEYTEQIRLITQAEAAESKTEEDDESPHGYFIEDNETDTDDTNTITLTV